MVGLLVMVTLSAAPLDVVISRNVDTTPERADDLRRRVAQRLASGGLDVRDPAQTLGMLPPGLDPASCAAKRACVREVGVALGSSTVIGIDVGHVMGEMAVNLEAISIPDGARVAQHSFVIHSAGYPAGVDAGLDAFARALGSNVHPADAPIAAVLEPQATAAPPEVVAPVSPIRVGPLVLGAGAIAVGVAAVVLAIAGSSTSNQVEQAKTTHLGLPASSLSRSRADQLATTANSEFLGAGLAAGASVALGTAALLWWRLGE